MVRLVVILELGSNRMMHVLAELHGGESDDDDDDCSFAVCLLKGEED